jgi:hypothetical protein
MAYLLATGADSVCRHRTGVKDNDLRLVRHAHSLMAGSAQTACQRFHLAIVEATANLVKKYTHRIRLI